MGGTCRINGMSGSCSDFTCVTSSQSSNNSGVSATNNDCKASTINDGCKTPSGRDGFCATDPDGSGYYCQSDTSATSAVIPSVNTNKCAENTVCYDGAGFEGKCTNGDCVFPKGVRYDNDPNACSESCSKTCVDVTPQGGQRGCGINGCWLCPA